MKPYLKIIALVSLINLSVFAQISHGTINYQVIPHLGDLSKADKSIQDILIKENEEAKKLNFTLNFLKTESYFFVNDMMFEGKSIKTLVLLVGGKLSFYQNKATQESREFLDTRRVGKVIVDRKMFYEWTLTNESKIIDGYKCYKATSPYFNNETGKKVENTNLVITAWYCPQIPVGFGPLGYGELPGLILELEKKAATFTATKINLNPEKEPEINRLTSPKAISEETLTAMYMGTFNPEQLKAIQESKDKK